MLERAAKAEVKRVIREIEPPRPSERLSEVIRAAEQATTSQRDLLKAIGER